MGKNKARVQVNAELTKKVAHLARMKLSEKEVELYTRHLESILSYVEMLSEVDLDQLNSQSCQSHRNEKHKSHLRSDEVLSFSDREALLESAPDVISESYRVPSVM